jgi:hypothetical protein
MYRRIGVSDFRPLVCVDTDQFIIDGLDGFILQFTRDENNTITAVTGNYAQGHSDVSIRAD